MIPGREAEPAVARELFGERIELARAFAENLFSEGELRGLIGPSEPSRLWSRHILNCVLVSRAIDSGYVGDVGAGAGFPGLVLAIARPDLDVALIEPMERRCEWLQEQIDSLDLSNAHVFRGRAEDVALQEKLDVVTARAVRALKGLIPLVTPLLRPGGSLALIKGASADREIAEAAKQIKSAKLVDVRVDVFTASGLDEPTRVVRATVI